MWYEIIPSSRDESDDFVISSGRFNENSAFPVPLLSVIFFSHEKRTETVRKIRETYRDLIKVFILLNLVIRNERQVSFQESANNMPKKARWFVV
jgi:hypothetical protein